MVKLCRETDYRNSNAKNDYESFLMRTVYDIHMIEYWMAVLRKNIAMNHPDINQHAKTQSVRNCKVNYPTEQ